MDWKKLREKYFKECVSSRTVKDSTGTCTDYHQWIQIAPHDLFEWFKRECESKEGSDETPASNCIKHAVIKSVCPKCGNDKYFDSRNGKIQCRTCGKWWRKIVL